MGEQADLALIAAFRASQYLGDVRCQQAMIEVAPTWEKRSQAAEARVASFHPVSIEEIKQQDNLDLYFVQSVYGSLNRLHFVKRNGFGHMNPPPDDYRCDSCHVKGWLRKGIPEFEA